MMLFKACPKCRGDIREESDIYGLYRQCCQCGHIIYPSPAPDSKQIVGTRVARPLSEAQRTIGTTLAKQAAALVDEILAAGMAREELAHACQVPLSLINLWASGSGYPGTRRIPMLKEILRRVRQPALV